MEAHERIERYRAAYALLAEAGVSNAKQWRTIAESYSHADYPRVRYVFDLQMGLLNLFDKAVDYVNTKSNVPGAQQVRFLSDTLRNEHLAFLLCMSEDGVIVQHACIEDNTDWRTHDLKENMPSVPSSLVEGLFAARPLLENGIAELVPSTIVRWETGIVETKRHEKRIRLDSAVDASGACFVRQSPDAGISDTTPELEDGIGPSALPIELFGHVVYS